MPSAAFTKLFARLETRGELVPFVRECLLEQFGKQAEWIARVLPSSALLLDCLDIILRETPSARIPLLLQTYNQVYV